MASSYCFTILPIRRALLELEALVAFSTSDLYFSRRCSKASIIVLGGGGAPKISLDSGAAGVSPLVSTVADSDGAITGVGLVGIRAISTTGSTGGGILISGCTSPVGLEREEIVLCQ